MITIKKTPFEEAIEYLGCLKPQLAELARSTTDNVSEIRLRAGQAVTLECNDKRVKINHTVTAEHIKECLKEFCGHSVHSFEKQFKEGWLTLPGGHRAGFTGTAVLRDGKVDNIRDVSSVNLRIARQRVGCAEDLYSRLCNSEEKGEFDGLLIIGKPLSAKTTVLRDLCRLISGRYKIALIDERSEVAACAFGTPTLDIGENTDVLNNFPKGEGIMTALRSLSPEYIVCDEIGWEVGELSAMVNCGVKMVLTAHSGGLREAYSSERIRALLSTGGISHIALLGSGKNIGKVEFYGTNKQHENNNGGDFAHNGDGAGSLFFMPIKEAGGVAP
ncbi:MAG: hypothetical protein FWF94_00685 [Oscillospiraceae bacterium]|nr:hypothetical protein [Oscillospiraceae bacterium]